MKAPKVGGWSPWGPIQHVKAIVPGHIWDIDTASHGGFKLDASYNKLVNPRWRAKGGWYEEDVEIAVVLITFQQSFPPKDVNMDNVRNVLARHYPKEYSDWWPYEKALEAESGVPYDAAKIKEETEEIEAELKGYKDVKPRTRKPQRIFKADLPGMKFIQVDPGDTVICDACGRDVTDDPASGGFIFDRRAYCPYCAQEALERIEKYGEEEFITHIAPEAGVSFADWVRRLRDEGEI